MATNSVSPTQLDPSHLDPTQLDDPTKLDLVAQALASPEIKAFIDWLVKSHTTGRRGYGPYALLLKHIYPEPVVSLVVDAIKRNPAARELLGCAPSDDAVYRFQKKLAAMPEALKALIEALMAAFREIRPDYGVHAAMDSTPVEAYMNSQPLEGSDGPPRTLSDPDATTGYRSAVGKRKAGFFDGYRVHAIVCATYRIPMFHRTETAREPDSKFALSLLDGALARGFTPETCTVDLGYWAHSIHDGFEALDCHPVSLLKKQARNKKDELDLAEAFRNDRPRCIHGKWTYGGTEHKRKRTQWRCPTGECSPKTHWLKASLRHPLIVRGTAKWKKLHAHGRMASEGFHSTAKEHHALDDLRTRGFERVRRHVDLSVIALFATALAKIRAGPQAP